MKYANRLENMKASEIREILKLTQLPDIISFAGGMPAPELFPIEEMKNITVKVLEESGQKALQYSTTEGFLPLREKIADRMKKFGIEAQGEDILITSGSQQGLDFAGKIFLNPKDVVICESPSYLGAISAFKAYECEFLEVATDDDGMIMEDLEKKLKENPQARLIYVIPDFQNPTGKTWSVERRKKLLELANKYDLPIIEDNPYGELRYDGEILPSLKGLDTEGRVVFLGSFSKIFCPGLRLGWVYASKEILEKFILSKQPADAHTSTMAQMEVNAFIENYDLDHHVEELKRVYKKRRDLMLNTMKETFPKEIKYTYPEGGLFIWVELPRGMDAKELMKKALEKKVAFVPGGSFFPNGGNENTFRLNYSNMTDERIVEGIRRLGEVLKTEILK
ncbi:PLP-dependent aminotransferase family protein [Crassaminicella profunda]|uniref:aminotransferase-like domain-containing protein n=1 Tax=Crassaminicella profunda TaxID=1286698 RepID=UPI001CA69B44|nr:PLP-dependent aminotransferase family protein [Crassaminicella profunda]QZY55120.1 PLP-dependent aminotransferase family protein [Crassaminicella profunda]